MDGSSTAQLPLTSALTTASQGVSSLLLLQIADSAFPSGAFAHSFGFEALRQLGMVKGEEELILRLTEYVWHTAFSALPFVSASHQGPHLAIDREAEVFLSNAVGNRASRAQGRSFLMAAEAAFGNPLIAELRATLTYAHMPVAFGATLGILGLGRVETQQVFLFGGVRAALSALVRLGSLGPLASQRILCNLRPVVVRAQCETAHVLPATAASISPLIELCQGAHDRLYSRIFQS